MEIKNNIICDLETGVCGANGETEMKFIDLSSPQKKVNLYSREKDVDALVSEQLANVDYETKEVLVKK